MITDNPNVLILARKLEQIPNVLQVRFWTPIRQTFKDLVGENCMAFVLVVNSVDPNDDIQFLKSIIPAEVINDLSLHDMLVANVTELVNSYLQTGIVPTKLLQATPADPTANVITTASILENYIEEPVSPTIGEVPPTP